jgi:uncharacterized membrane protein YhaH (DUF805 family)
MPDSSTESTQQALAILSTFGAITGIIAIASVVFAIIIYWRIFSKAGYSGAMSLLMLVPIANLIVICILAFGEWPIHRELNQLRQQVAMMRPPQPQYPQYR